MGEMVCRMSGDAEMDHAARAQLDDDEHEHCAEEDIVRLKEIAGPNLGWTMTKACLHEAS